MRRSRRWLRRRRRGSVSQAEELSDDHTPTVPVIAHAIRWLEAERGPVDFACCIYATAPFLQPSYLREGLELLRLHVDGQFAFSVTSFAFPIFRALKKNADGIVGMFSPEHELSRSQDLPEAWHDAGQFYWGRKEAFLTQTRIFPRGCTLVLPSSSRAGHRHARRIGREQSACSGALGRAARGRPSFEIC